MLEEIWKDIPEYVGLYQISNLGRVKSLGNGSSNNSKLCKERILKPEKTKNGYLRLNLYKDGFKKSFNIHRLVAEAFIPNPNNFPQVGHLDENSTNNCVENLSWMTSLLNNNFIKHKQRISEAQTNNPKVSKPIKCLDLETNELHHYPSIREAARQFNVHSTIIWQSIYKMKSPYKKRYIFSEV